VIRGSFLLQAGAVQLGVAALLWAAQRLGRGRWVPLALTSTFWVLAAGFPVMTLLPFLPMPCR